MTRVVTTSKETLLAAVIVTGAGSPVAGRSGVKTYQAHGVTTAGAGAGTVLIQGSNDGFAWDLIGTLSLTLATTIATGVSDSFVSDDRYQFIRANCSVISGTNAAVTASMSF
jgi:hypothetical protein